MDTYADTYFASNGVFISGFVLTTLSYLGSVCTERQHQRCNNDDMFLNLLLSLKTMESLQNGVATQFSSDSIVFNENSIASIMQSCHSVDADAWCNRTLVI